MKLTTAQERKFQRLVAGLNTLLVEVQQSIPEANYYLAMESLNLMAGESHTGRDLRPRQDRILTHAVLRRSGGGDW